MIAGRLAMTYDGTVPGPQLRVTKYRLRRNHDTVRDGQPLRQHSRMTGPPGHTMPRGPHSSGGVRMPQTRAADLGLAAVAAAAAVGGTFIEILGASRAVPPLSVGVLLALIAGALVLWRRTPLPVTVAVTS